LPGNPALSTQVMPCPWPVLANGEALLSFASEKKKDTPEKKIATQQDIDEVRNSCQEQKDVGNDVEHRASKHRYSTNILGYLQHDRTE